MELAGKVIAVLEPRGGVSKTGNENQHDGLYQG